MKEAFAYVDPGSGFVFLQNTSFLWGWILAFLMFFLVPLKFFLKRVKKPFWVIIGIIAALFTLGVIMKGMMNKDLDVKKVIILGVDAMDPDITQRLMDEGRLVHFASLKKQGGFSSLATTNPSESVVAWSSFSTGLNPGGHGIFDFVMREPKKYLPFLSLSEVRSRKGKLEIKTRRKGRTFWDILSDNKIPSFIYFCPNTFPAQKLLGELISGMGVPDISGMVGKFSFYTTQPLEDADKNSRGKIVNVLLQDGVVLTALYGPKIARGTSVREAEVPLKITLKTQEKSISFEFQKKELSLKEGQWSDWQQISFNVGLLKKSHGIVRFYLKSVAPELELYASPINFDPNNPLFPISYPANLSKELAEELGLFYTQGMAHDTWALSEERLSDAAFLEHADIILEEKKKILLDRLNSFDKGAFFFYFDTLDAIQHMFWRYLDKEHSRYEPNSVYEEIIFEYYQKLDRILGEVLQKIDKDTVLIVLSDHGFGTFRKSVNLNRWLLENGFLSLSSGLTQGREFFEDIDWANTRAYALGFGGIYINRAGREGYGIVSDSEAEDIKGQIITMLQECRDPRTGDNIVKDVYRAEDIFTGPYIGDAPDLFVGFNSGYRASWQTALGGVPALLIEDNKKKWSGDHLVDPGLVKGVIFVNKKAELKNPHITDIASTVLGLFDIARPEDMQGKELF